MEIEKRNKEFTADLRATCERVLKESISVERYVTAVLDEMFWGQDQLLADADGDMHHEIAGRHTKSGNPETITG